MRFIILPAVAALVLAACATMENRAEPRQERELVTGSNIPRKDPTGSGVAVANREALERLQNSSGGATTRGSEVPRN
jgi:hypothetical protein